jgi:RNA recognition motif-containing protein
MDIRLCFHPNGQPRGFAFCEFPTSHDAQAAIHALHGRTLLSRTLIVQEASPAGNNTKNNMTTTSHNQYYNHAGRGGTRDSAGASVTTPRREMKREEINDKIAKLKRALQENNNNP